LKSPNRVPRVPTFYRPHRFRYDIIKLTHTLALRVVIFTNIFIYYVPAVHDFQIRFRLISEQISNQSIWTRTCVRCAWECRVVSCPVLSSQNWTRQPWWEQNERYKSTRLINWQSIQTKGRYPKVPRENIVLSVY